MYTFFSLISAMEYDIGIGRRRSHRGVDGVQGECNGDAQFDDVGIHWRLSTFAKIENIYANFNGRSTPSGPQRDALTGQCQLYYLFATKRSIGYGSNVF